MSGLDPLGRRDMRALVLRLRDRGCTVFFSSHILSDAEALCGRVGILARGRLLAAGRIADLLAGNVRGWELIVAGVSAAVLTPLASRATSVTSLDEGRHTLVLPSSAAPEPLIAELIAAGARIVSLTPVHQTLEEYFVGAGGPQRRQEASPRERPHRRARGRRRVPRIGARPRALQPRRVCGAADWRLASPRAAHRRAGAEDRQGPWSRGDVTVRAVHRRVHRHRAGVERGRPPHRACPAG